MLAAAGDTQRLAANLEGVREDLRRRSEEIRLLSEIGRVVASLDDLDQILSRLVEAAAYVTDAEEASIDIIIVDSTDPVGPAVGLFTENFYKECRRVLHTDGILVQQSESPLYHLDLLQKMHKDMRKRFHRTSTENTGY